MRDNSFDSVNKIASIGLVHWIVRGIFTWMFCSYMLFPYISEWLRIAFK